MGLNHRTCNTILSCWAKSGSPEHAEAFLEETMQQNKHNLIPDIVSYNTIIHGYARLGNLNRALELFTRLLEGSLSKTNSSSLFSSEDQKSLLPEPNSRTFTSILIALSKKKTIESAKEAETLLLKMQELHDPPYNLDTRPTRITY